MEEVFPNLEYDLADISQGTFGVKDFSFPMLTFIVPASSSCRVTSKSFTFTLRRFH